MFVEYPRLYVNELPSKGSVTLEMDRDPRCNANIPSANRINILLILESNSDAKISQPFWAAISSIRNHDAVYHRFLADINSPPRRCRFPRCTSTRPAEPAIGSISINRKRTPPTISTWLLGIFSSWDQTQLSWNKTKFWKLQLSAERQYHACKCQSLLIRWVRLIAFKMRPIHQSVTVPNISIAIMKAAYQI